MVLFSKWKKLTFVFIQETLHKTRESNGESGLDYGKSVFKRTTRLYNTENAYRFFVCLTRREHKEDFEGDCGYVVSFLDAILKIMNNPILTQEWDGDVTDFREEEYYEERRKQQEWIRKHTYQIPN